MTNSVKGGKSYRPHTGRPFPSRNAVPAMRDVNPGRTGHWKRSCQIFTAYNPYMRSPSCAHMVKRWPGLPMLIASLLGTWTTSHNPLLQTRYGPEARIGGSWAIAVHRVRGFLWCWAPGACWPVLGPQTPHDPLVGIGHPSKKLKLIIGQIHANAMVLGPCQKLTKLLLIFRAPRHDDYFEPKWKLSTVRSHLLLKFWTPGMLHMQHALYTQIAGK